MAHILPKKSIHPVFLPPKCFIDMFGKPNAYFDMNPSMYIDSDGTVKILVRRIDYRKFHDKQFTMYNPYSNSHYSLMTGRLVSNQPLNLDSFSIEEMVYEYNRPTYNTYWKGLEDIRFISVSSILACIPECNPKGNPSIFRATLQDNHFHSFIDCHPNHTEKNWMPYNDNDNDKGNNFVIYSLSPFKIKSIETDDLRQIDIPEQYKHSLEGYNGSTNGIHYKEGYILFLAHINKEKTYHRFILFHPSLSNVVVSVPFVFFNNSYIEFPISICEFENRYFISLGINDDKAFILEITSADIEQTFR